MKKNTLENENFRINIFETNSWDLTLCIVGGVHGNEICGLEAIQKIETKLLAEDILLNSRLITMVANYQAIQRKKRFIDYDLNRAFANPNAFGHEKYLAQQLTPFLGDIDYLIDLHSTSAPTQPFCAGNLTQKHLNLFSMTGIEVYTHGWEIHRGYSMLIDEVNRSGGVGIIAECGQHNEVKTYHVAYHLVLSVLEELKMVKSNRKLFPLPTTVIKIEKIIKAKTNDFSFVRHFQNFETIAKNEIVAYDGENPIAFPEPYRMVMPTYSQLISGEEAFGIGII